MLRALHHYEVVQDDNFESSFESQAQKTRLNSWLEHANDWFDWLESLGQWFGKSRPITYSLVWIQRKHTKPAHFQNEFIDFRFQWSSTLHHCKITRKIKQTQKNNFSSTFCATQISTMSTLKTIKEAIAALKDRTGSSVIAINRWIEAEKKVRQC